MKVCGIILVFVFIGIHSIAQQFQSADTRAILGAGIALNSGNIIDENPASTLKLSHKQISIGQQNDFGLGNLNAFQFAIAIPNAHQSYGIAFHQNNFDALTSQRWCLNATVLLKENIRFGLTLNAIRSKFANEQASINFIPEIGFIYERKRRLYWALHLINFGINDKKNQIPSAVRIGINQQINEQIALCAALCLSKSQAYLLKAGLSYELNSSISIRAAIASASPFLGYGIAYKKKRIVYWLSNNHHFFLGNSPAIKINYAF
jgi:hypothetical protein